MDLTKIGTFIMQQRKMANLTQEKLAKMLNVTDKAVSKWERGLSFPDTSLLSSLAVILKCSVSELLAGERQNVQSSHKLISHEEYKNQVKGRSDMEKIIFIMGDRRVVSPYLFGENLEHTRNSVHAGLSAEMLENRKFAGKPGNRKGCASQWTPIGERAYFIFDEYEPYTRHAKDYHMNRMLECNAQRITLFYPGESAGIGQGGLTVEKDKEYQFEIAVRAAEEMELNIRLLDRDGEELAAGKVEVEGKKEYAEKSLLLKPDKDCEDAALTITFDKKGTVFIGAVSLMPADNFRGMRRDVVEALRKLGIRILRWPGGNFAGEYNWKDGLLPRNMRAPLQSTLWLETQPYSMGFDFHEINIDDFAMLCKEIGAEPYITINPAWNTPEESAQWVEYCNGDATTEYGRLRMERGYGEPYNVKFWSLGNEFGYGHMEGANTPAEYAKVVKEHAQAMLKVTPSLKLCSSGPYPDKDWCQNAAKPLATISKMVSLHRYAKYPDYIDEAFYKQEYEKLLESVEENYNLAKELRRDLDDDSIRISFDEWNAGPAWWHPENVSDSIYMALMFHMFIMEAEELGIDVVCHFEAVNEGCMYVEKTNTRLTPMGHALSIVSQHAGGSLLYASRNVIASEKEGKVTVTLVNPSYDEQKEYHIPAHGKQCRGLLYSSDSVLPYSEFDVRKIACEVQDDTYALFMPPHSIAIVELRYQNMIFD